MTDFFRKMKNKNMVYVFAAVVACGALLLFARRFDVQPEAYIRETFYKPVEAAEKPPAEKDAFTQELALEARLEEFFGMVENAGKVRVMISPLGSRETVFAVDVSGSRSHTTEQDSQGGSRETHQYQSAEKTVIITNRQGTDTPLILREIEPRTEGIVIIAEGGDCPFVRDALTRAARAVLGLEAHMIQVLTMQIN
ncbi:MAG: hypothetical protein FWB96_13115 [Defluviitaleaceae bacterium]|nr:hypothetical protein [Defluviitaleaceae bacterium]MCL2264170.1 hypothetical protein [Defluviitaleaceae bacterium]